MTKQEYMAFSLYKGLKVDIRYNNGCADTKCIVLQGYDLDQEYKVTPYCRPLSDLTKPIEHNGEKFVPIVELAKMRSSIVENVIPRAFEAIKIDIKSKRLPFDMVLKLIEWKFDIANLIESGEAIDVNTLETNPYK